MSCNKVSSSKGIVVLAVGIVCEELSPVQSKDYSDHRYIKFSALMNRAERLSSVVPHLPNSQFPEDISQRISVPIPRG